MYRHRESENFLNAAFDMFLLVLAISAIASITPNNSTRVKASGLFQPTPPAGQALGCESSFIAPDPLKGYRKVPNGKTLVPAGSDENSWKSRCNMAGQWEPK